MNITLKATGIELTPAISDYAEKKVRSVERILHEPLDAYLAAVELAKTTRHHKEGFVFRAEVHLTGNHLDLYASVEAEDLYAAIDLVKDEIVREIESRKEKRLSILRRGQRTFKNIVRGVTERFSRSD